MNTHPGTTDTSGQALHNLPALRLREEMLRRAKIALGEAQVLTALLDSVTNQPLNTASVARHTRPVFGFQLSDFDSQNGRNTTP